MSRRRAKNFEPVKGSVAGKGLAFSSQERGFTCKGGPGRLSFLKKWGIWGRTLHGVSKGEREAESGEGRRATRQFIAHSRGDRVYQAKKEVRWSEEGTEKRGRRLLETERFGRGGAESKGTENSGNEARCQGERAKDWEKLHVLATRRRGNRLVQHGERQRTSLGWLEDS